MNLRRLLQFRLPTMLIAVAALSALLVANTRPSDPVMLGHVSSDEPGIRPGLSILGNKFGWPWTWRVESFKGGLLESTPFDGINRQGLAADLMVGFLIVAAATFVTELAWRGRSRRVTKDCSGGAP